MDRLTASGLVFAVLVFSAGEASACRVHRPPAEHLASPLSEPYEAIVIATVSELETVGSDDVPWWRATFEVERPVKGEPQKRVFTSEQIGGGGVCWRVPTPAIGERWVVFLTHATDVDGFAYPQALVPEEIWNGRSGSRD